MRYLDKMNLYKDRDWLEQKYWEERLTYHQIAELCKKNESTIGRWFKKFNIPRDCSRRQFKKGNISWNKGKHLSKETKRKIGIANKGNKVWLGKKHTKETKEKISIARKGIHISEEGRRKLKNRPIRMGKLASGWKGGKIEIKCDLPGCNICIRKFPCIIKKNKHCFCCHEHADLFNKGKNNYCYIDGKGNWPHPLEFNNKLKLKIRKRDNYACRKCGIKENGKAHACHHIDYDKTNNEDWNLILLCTSCHSKTNSNRQYWQNYFEFQMPLKSMDISKEIL